MSRLVNVHIPSSVLLLATHGLLQLVEETVFTLIVMAARLVVSRCAVPEVPAVDAIATGLFAPVENQEQAEEHTAQVREVSHAVGSTQSLDQFDERIEEHKPLGLDREGDRDDEEFFVRINHTERKQDAVHRTRCTNRHGLRMNQAKQLSQLLHESSTQSTYYIIKEKFLASPRLLHDTSKHPESEHVEKDV